MFARNTELLELESAGDKKLLEISNFGFELGNVGLNPFPNSVQKLRYSNLHCT